MAYDRDSRQPPPASTAPDGSGGQVCPPVPMIVRVYGDGVHTDVPVTPATTCRDLVDCCRDPGEEHCQLVGLSGTHGEWPLRGEQKPLEILQRWGSDPLKLVLRYTVMDTSKISTGGRTQQTRHGMKEPGHLDEPLPEGVQLTLSELREMACRQQQQIDTQHQLLAAKEQRLRYLKEQEARHQRVAHENERLRRLRERVEAQELKLRKLRALRGQVDHNKHSNASLTSDLDSIRALFNEKEKELSLAVAKVEELTRQLEELRRGRPRPDQTPSAAALELDKLRRELLYRNKLNEQQNQRLCQQREALTARQEEMSNIDKRISELQDRLHRKRLLNQQLANHINQQQQQHQLQMQQPPLLPPQHSPHAPPSMLARQQQLQLQQRLQMQPIINRGNIAAVEPYKHVPPPPTDPETVQPLNELPEFAANKADPKYQTLPYNTKFTVNFVTPQNKKDLENNNWQPSVQDQQITVPPGPDPAKHMTVHSIPLSQVNKSLATPLISNGQPTTRSDVPGRPTNGTVINSKSLRHIPVSRGQPVGQPASVPAPIPTSQHRPISSVAPNTVAKHSTSNTIYQTSSTKIQPVQPQQLALSPPGATSTPLGTPETLPNINKICQENSNLEKPSTPKPALPPKPSIKPPPRQTTPSGPQTTTGEEESSSGSTEEMPPPTPPVENVPAIRARPLTIKKQSLGGEQPRLRIPGAGPKPNGYHVSINRRIEMPPAFLFPETDSPPPDLLGQTDQSTQQPRPATPPCETTEEKSTERETDNSSPNKVSEEQADGAVSTSNTEISSNGVVLRTNKKGNLKQGKAALQRRVSFDPLALLLDASLEGELELVKKTATQVSNPSAANDEGITALHNAICAGHLDIVKFLVEFGCDVNAQDSDGWTPLHCAASCNNVAMVRFLVEHGACIFATTLSDHETAAEKCEEDEEGFDGCSEYLYSVQEKLGILNGGSVYAVFDYTAQQPDELSFTAGQQLTILRKGDENEREWWWARLGDNEGYVPRNLLGLCPRVTPKSTE